MTDDPATPELEDEDAPSFEGWCILELMGHRRVAGYARDVAMFGVTVIRIDVPRQDDAAATMFYAPHALYCLTPTTEDVARRVAEYHRPRPAHAWELEGAREDSDEPDDEPDEVLEGEVVEPDGALLGDGHPRQDDALPV